MNVVIYNSSASTITIALGTATHLRLAGTTQNGARTLQAKGLATVLCVATGDYVISGAGVL
jgi:hypothetical protein